MGYNNPYSPLLLSHQTGLSITASTANTFYAIGEAISIPRNGTVFISISGHVSAGNGYIQLGVTRGTNNYLYGNLYNSLFANTGYYSNYNSISTPNSIPLFTSGNFSNTSDSTIGSAPSFILPVFVNDSLQFYAANNTANDITYIDDLLVILQ